MDHSKRDGGDGFGGRGAASTQAATFDQPYGADAAAGFAGVQLDRGGLRTGLPAPVQLLAVPGSAQDDPGQVQDAAARGTSGASAPLPFLDRIQDSFGRHDVGGVQAHVGAEAREGANAMGAEAFATGNQVAFAGAPTLHTTAHEAAHVVQQRAGVHLKGGVGAEGDVHEQHADRVADGVVRGESVEGLLDEAAGSSSGVGPSGAGASSIQRKKIFTWWARDKDKLKELIGSATDTTELDGTSLGKLIEFLEIDLDGKGQIAVLKQLKVELVQKNGSDKVKETGKKPTPKLEQTTTVEEVTKPIEEVTKPIEQTKPVEDHQTSDDESVGHDEHVETKPVTSTPTVITGGEVTQKPTPIGDTGTVVEQNTPKKDEDKGSTEGMLTITGIPAVNVPADEKKVFKGGGDHFTASYGGKSLRVMAGQNYLNTELSATYKADKDKIKGSEVSMAPPFAGQHNQDDVRVVGDGHHRLVWAAYHGESIPVREDKKKAIPNLWSGMVYKPTPEGMKLEPITETASIKEDFFLGYVSPELGFTKFSHESVEAFAKAFAVYKKYLWDDEHGKQLVDHIQQRLDENPVRDFNAVVTALAKKSSSESAGGYESYLKNVGGFFGNRKSPVVFGPTLTSGNFNSIYNVITIDPVMLPDPQQQLDTLTFETQNARQKSKLTTAKQKTNSGEEIAKVEYESDKKYVTEALMTIHKAKTLDALVAKLGIAEELLVEEAFDTASQAGGVTMPEKSTLSEQAQRQALWWWKTKAWNDKQRQAMWGKAPHGEGVSSSEELYQKH